MAQSATGTKSRGLRTTHTCAIVVALISGSYALVALVIGSPLEFGISLALCGAGWVAAHFVEWTVEHDARSRTATTRRSSDHWSTHAVFVGTRTEGPRVINHPSSRPQRYCLAPQGVRVLHGTRRMSA